MPHSDACPNQVTAVAIVAAAEIGARLDRLPSSRAKWRIVLLISLGCVFEFYDLFFTAYVAPGMLDSGLRPAHPLSLRRNTRECNTYNKSTQSFGQL